MSAASRWANTLAAWAIPDEILAAAPESPWGFNTSFFASSAVSALAAGHTPTHEAAADALPEAGSVLDVGCGAGAASLPLAPPARRIIGVDISSAMLDELRALAREGTVIDTVVGRWPDVAMTVEPADVVVCAHVAYNVADLGPFVAALAGHARERVVMELTTVHPQSTLAPLWRHFWGIDRPLGPTAADALAVIKEVVGGPVSSQSWSRDVVVREPIEAVPWIRRRLCLPASADVDIAARLGSHPQLSPAEVITVWW